MTRQTRADFKDETIATIYTNTTKDVTGAEVRERINSLADSAVIQEDWDPIVSSGTVQLATSESNFVQITGTNTITSFGSSATAGILRWVRFSGSLTLTHSSTGIILPGGSNIQTASKDTMLVLSEGSDVWRVLYYTKFNGSGVLDPLLLAGGTLTGALTINSGTQTANNPSLIVQQTWNNGAVSFNGISVELTDTASATGSKIVRLRVGSNNRFEFVKGGQANALGASTTNPAWRVFIDGDTDPRVSIGINSSDNGRIGFGPGNVSVDTTIIRTGAGALTMNGDFTAISIITSATNFLHRTTGTLANGAAAAAGTLLNAPTAGNPTKWIPIDDNGVTRYCPAW